MCKGAATIYEAQFYRASLNCSEPMKPSVMTPGIIQHRIFSQWCSANVSRLHSSHHQLEMSVSRPLHAGRLLLWQLVFFFQFSEAAGPQDPVKAPHHRALRGWLPPSDCLLIPNCKCSLATLSSENKPKEMELQKQLTWKRFQKWYSGMFSFHPFLGNVIISESPKLLCASAKVNQLLSW